MVDQNNTLPPDEQPQASASTSLPLPPDEGGPAPQGHQGMPLPPDEGGPINKPAPTVIAQSQKIPKDLQAPVHGSDEWYAQTVAQAIPQSVLETGKRYLVDPFEQLVAWGQAGGRKVGEELGTEASTMVHPGSAVEALKQGGDVMSTLEKKAHEQSPHLMGVAQGVGATVGGVALDPRNWPLMSKAAAQGVLGKLMAAGFGTMMTKGAWEGAKQLAENWDDMTPEQRSELATQTGLGTVMAVATALHLVEGTTTKAKAAIKKAADVGMTEKQTAGGPVPVQSETVGGKLARQVVSPEVVKDIAQEKTAPAVQKAVGEVAAKVTGSKAETAVRTEKGDSFGLGGHADNLVGQATPVFDRIDELSGGKLTAAKDKVAAARGDFTKTKDFNEGKAEQQALYDQYRDQLKSEGMDVDSADKLYRRSVQLDKMRTAFERAINPDTGELSGKRLSTEIGKLVAKGEKSPLRRADFTDEHIASLREIADIMKDQEVPPTQFVYGTLRAVSALLGVERGGLTGLTENIFGERLLEMIGRKLSDRFLAQAMSEPSAVRGLANALQSGNVAPVVAAVNAADPTWLDNAKTFLHDTVVRLWEGEAGQAGKPGTVFEPHEIEELKKIGLTDDEIARMQGKKGKWPTSDSLIRKYGESTDPGQTAFITPEGKGIAQAGKEHDVMLGGTPKDDLRTPFINETGHIRMRAHGTFGGRQFNLSLPESGITEAQLELLKKWEPQLRSGRQYIEVAKPDGKSIVLQHGTGQSTEAAIRSLVPIKGTPKMEAPLEIARAHNANNGFTYNPQEGLVKGKPVFSVAGAYDSLAKTIDKPRLTEGDIKAFMNDPEVKAALESDPRNSIGGWVHKGKSHLEISRLFHDRDEAIAEGKRLNQIEIYDHANKTGIPTGGTGVAPAETQQAKTVANLSSPGPEGAGSAEAISRLQSQQAQGLQTYDVDSRMAGSKEGWHPVMASVDRVDLQAKPYHHLVQFDPKTGAIEVLSSGENARPLPPNERMQQLVAQAAGPAPKTAARPVDELAGKEIATRNPTSAKSSPENNPELLAGMKAVDEADRLSPSRVTQEGKPVLGYKQKLAASFADYKDNGLNFTPEELQNPDALLEKTINHLASNLEWLHNAIPESIRNVSKGWYESAHNFTKQLARNNGISHEQAAGVTAVLSPQNNWDNNVGQAQRIIEHYTKDQNHAWTPEMDNAITEIRNSAAINPVFKRMLTDIRGKTLNELTAKNPKSLAAKRALWFRVLDEAHGNTQTPIYSPDGTIRGSQTFMWNGLDPIAKALSILDNGSVQNIHEVIGDGHKVRNFYNNIINPWSSRGHLTIDTHAVGAGWLKPFSGENTEVAHNFGSGNKQGIPSPPKHAETGLKGSYPVYEEAYRRAAAKLGLRPRELQSITWEGIRALMGDNKKTPELKRAVNAIWAQHEAGMLTLDQARQEIVKASGGFSKPEWMPDSQWEGNPAEPEETSFNFGANEGGQ